MATSRGGHFQEGDRTRGGRYWLLTLEDVCCTKVKLCVKARWVTLADCSDAAAASGVTPPTPEGQEQRGAIWGLPTSCRYVENASYRRRRTTCCPEGPSVCIKTKKNREKSRWWSISCAGSNTCFAKVQEVWGQERCRVHKGRHDGKIKRRRVVFQQPGQKLHQQTGLYVMKSFPQTQSDQRWCKAAAGPRFSSTLTVYESINQEYKWI